ncbi:hypothetical protein [Hymenobacter sp. B1770]|uniref:hypothetical protein n=1 Tax=Hymenobacter sp. B1770 TaxID=1718788 RepID=UPI003CFA22F2
MRPLWLPVAGLFLLSAVAAPPFALVALTPAAFHHAVRAAPPASLRLEYPVRKSNGAVRIPLGGGGYKTFADRPVNAEGTDETEQLTYTYVGYMPDFRQHLLQERAYESSQWLLVSETGETTPLWSQPLPSPDRVYLLTSNGSLDYDVMPTGLQLFRQVGGRVVKQWEHRLTTWEPRQVQWLTNDRLCLQGVVPAHLSATGKRNVFYRSLVLQR